MEKKKNRSRTGDSSSEYTSNTCNCVHTDTHIHTLTYANNKELHRHWVTLETLANKHMCAHAGIHTWSSMFSHKLCVTLVFMKHKEANILKQAHPNKHVWGRFSVYT